MAEPYATIDVSVEIVSEDRKPTREFEDYLYRREVLMGSGSPEGVVAADPTTFYMDTAGSAGNILYIKKTGNDDTGWILV